LFPDHDSARSQPEEQVAPPETFIPQAAERAPLRTPRMPKFEELPMPAQAEIRQARGDNRGDNRGDRADSQVRSDVAEDDHPQKRMSLLQRLANVGLGRRDDEVEPPVAGRSGGPSMPPLPDRKPQRSVSQQIAANEPVSEYARRPAPQGLDTHGRPAPVAPAPQGDDHLDIPAFLRRQAN
jgi:cell division protein FtsZ